jgi:hypothetical protein
MTAKISKKLSCSICKKPVQKTGNEFLPFCSEQCKLIDLGNWLGDKYSVDSDEPAPEEDRATPG